MTFVPTILNQIVATKRTEIERAKATVPLSDLQRRLIDAPPVHDFFGTLAAGPRIKLIAEIKKASPSKGVIRAGYSVSYNREGIAALQALSGNPGGTITAARNLSLGNLAFAGERVAQAPSRFAAWRSAVLGWFAA